MKYECDIMTKPLTQSRGNWSLKIEQQEIEEVQSEKKYSAKEISLNSEREYYSNKK